MGADSRTSTGIYVANRVSDKISKIYDNVFVCRSGSAADTQAISDIAKYYLSLHAVERGEVPLVATAANIFKDLCYGNKDRLMAGIICAGWDKKDGGQVFNIPLGGTLVKQPFTFGGSGSTYIYGYCDAYYKPDMSKEECMDFVKNAISLAMARDGSSGGIIRLNVIDSTGSHKTFVDANDLPYQA
jgi:20S proteasome subunit beta 1